MSKTIYKTFSCHQFHDLETASFSPVEYSKLKFGCDAAAKNFGRELAIKFYKAYAPELLANQVVVIPSPYNCVKNAASILTEHFCNTLNLLLVEENGAHVDCSIIHRKVSYTNDYGFLAKEERQKLLGNDEFYFNSEFVKGKTLIFVDDIKITGTHEDKLIEILRDHNMDNSAFFLYIAEYLGENAAIESQLNFYAFKNIKEIFPLLADPENHVIVRPIKFLLSCDKFLLSDNLDQLGVKKVAQIYYAALAEGYYALPAYHRNFSVLREKVRKMGGIEC